MFMLGFFPLRPDAVFTRVREAQPLTHYKLNWPVGLRTVPWSGLALSFPLKVFQAKGGPTGFRCGSKPLLPHRKCIKLNQPNATSDGAQQ